MSLQVEILEQSFGQIKPKANEFVSSFYENLFAASPQMKPLFEHINMEQQKKMLLRSLVLVVKNLRQPDVLRSTLQGLGTRHGEYGALPEYYPFVGDALLKTFKNYLGEQWTPTVQHAWVDAYGAITALMPDGAGLSPKAVRPFT